MQKWRCLDCELTTCHPRNRKPKNSEIINKDRLADIKQWRRNNHLTYQDIADKLHISRQRVYRILHPLTKTLPSKEEGSIFN